LSGSTEKAGSPEELSMRNLISRWRRTRRYRATVRDLRSLAPEHLSALGIEAADIDRLARKASDAGLPPVPSSAERLDDAALEVQLLLPLGQSSS
jgi:uncharacterized protein YjiS (DUF1127 family)